jgi:hypothetical protein
MAMFQNLPANLRETDFFNMVNHLIEGIDKTEDDYGPGREMQRMMIRFKNGYRLSIITGFFAHGGQQGLFEIAPFNADGIMDGSVLDIDGDDVLGYLKPEEVWQYVITMANKKFVPKEIENP